MRQEDFWQVLHTLGPSTIPQLVDAIPGYGYVAERRNNISATLRKMEKRGTVRRVGTVGSFGRTIWEAVQ